MATGLDIVKGALRRITSYQSGETIGGIDQQDCMDSLNDLLDSWSTDELYVPGTVENIAFWVPGKNQYKIGNPLCTAIGLQPFSGTVTNGSPTITGVTNIPSQLVSGATLTDVANSIPAGTTVINFNAGAQTVTMSQNASSTPSSNPEPISFTVPGDFAFARPLRITSGFTRFSALDFTLDVFESQDEYNSILYKAQPGPWPTVAWYNNAFPYGILNVYQTPGNSAELHLFTDVILANLTTTSVVQVPQGYVRALKWCLARELWTEYVSPITVPTMLEKLASEALQMIQGLNAKPAVRSKYDRMLVKGNRADGGWILRAGYR